jgi:TP901 family phage tail tape measure protein
MAAINLDIGGNTRRLDRDIQKTVNRVYTINLKTKGDQPLGRITGQVNEFNKSLDASNARVIAFGASAGIIFGVQRAFTALVGATIEVQKSLQDINVILNVSAQNLQKFGGELFSIAKNTGQSFQEVAKAATEFSRQGLGVEETLKRTSEALILSRLSGLDAAKSVEALTAAVNSYASQAVTASEVVNKFANVDAAFAVSSADLAEALQRVGSSAAQSGVSLNELIAIVTSAQQTTARGGAVIGNSFKTIFTRLQRGKVVDLLESLGISSTDSSGQVKSTIQLLQDLGKVYDTLGSQQQSYVAEQVGGVFQINILKAALADLGKEYSIYSSALNVAAGSTDQAIRRNEELNKTYAAQLNALQENARQLASAAGERLVGPSIDRLVGGSNALLGGINESDGQGFGAVLGKGILDGLGQFIAGPGLALIGGVLLKLFRDLGKFATGSVQQLLGLNTAATQQRDLQASIGQILAKNPQLLELALKGEQGLNTAANSLLASLQKQTVELQKQATVAQQISRAFVAQAGVRVTGGVPVVPTGRTGKAAGYIPNFAKDDFAREELLASALGAKNPTAQLSKGTIDGKKFIKNNREVEITNFGNNGDSAVIPNYAKGFIPNFQKASQTPKEIVVAGAKKYGYLIPSTAPGRLSTPDKPIPGGTVTDTANNIKYIFPPQTAYGPKLIGESEASNKLENQIYQSVLNRTASYTKRLAPPGNPVSPSDLEKGFQSAKGARGAVLSAIGAAFEVGITTALGYEAASSKVGAGDFDVRAGKGIEKIQSLFGIGGITKADFKATTGGDSVTSFRKKILREEFGSFGKKGEGKPRASRKSLEARKNIQFSMLRKKKNAAAGYIPNFAAIQDAVSRERAAGIPSNQIYLAQEQALRSANPMGIGVFNKQDEPTKGSRKNAMRSKGFARGYIPNFAETPESSAASIGTVTAALVSQLGILAITLQGSGQQYKESLKELTQANVTQAKINSKNLSEQIKQQNIEPSLLDAKQRQKVRTPEQQAQRNAAAQELRASRDKQKTAARGTGGQKLGAGVRAGGFALGIAAPILAQTLSQAIPQETKEGRVAAAGVGSLGNIGAAAATGAAFGPIGAAVGAAAGALLEIPNFVGALSTNFPELQAAVQKSSQELTKFSDAGSKLLTSFESLESSLKDPNASQDLINKASDAYAQALTGLSLEDQKRLEQAAKIGKLEDEYAKILSEKTAELQSRESAAEAGRIAGEAETTNNLINMGLGAATVIPGIGPLVSALESFGVVDAIRPNALESASKEDKSNQQAFMSQVLQGKTGEDAVGAIQNAGGTNFIKELLQIQPGDTKGLENLLNKTIPEGAGKADFVAAQVQMANNGTAAFGNVINSLGTGFTKATVEAKAADKAGKALAAAQRVEIKAKDAAVKATEQIIDSLERNIRMAQMAADTNRALAKANSEFQRNTAFADDFSRPTETVGAIVGEGAPLAEAFTLRESIAKIGFDQINQIEGVKSLFVNDINESIKTAFNEGVGETRGKATGEGTAADIQKGNTDILKPLAGQQEKAFAIVQDVLNKTASGGGEINTEAVLSNISNSLKDANINGETIQKITAQVRDAGTKGNLEIAKLRNDSINEFKTLAKEQTQKILISKIGQAQKFGGGIGEFMDPQGSGESLFGKVVKSTKGFDQFQGQQADFRFDYKAGSNEFKSGSGAAQRARQEMAPEYGRAALDLTDQLQAFTGYTPNADGKAVQAGEAGLKEFYDRQVKQLQTVAKDSSTPQIVKDEINAALKEVNKLGGTKNIAKLQVAQRTGALTESGFKEITGKFQNPVLQSLQEQAKLVGSDTPEGQSLLKQIEEIQKVTITSQDPTIQAINSGNVILNQILTAIQNEGTSGVTTDSTGLIVDSTKAASTDVNKAVQKAQTQTPSSSGLYTGGYINGMRADEATIPDSAGQQSQSDFEQFRSGTAERKAAADAELQRVLNSDTSGQQAKADFEAFRESQRIVDPGNEYALEEDRVRREMIDRDRMIGASSPTSTSVQNQPAAAAQQSFTQQEASLGTNTSAITTLAGGIESLNATIANFESNFANLNNVPGTQPVAGAQPNVQTTTSAPVNVVVNAQGGTDIATAVGQAVQNAIPTIVEKVRIAMGQKVPPTVARPPLTTNPKLGAGQRADGGFLL